MEMLMIKYLDLAKDYKVKVSAASDGMSRRQSVKWTGCFSQFKGSAPLLTKVANCGEAGGR
jgi:hypothetical protein